MKRSYLLIFIISILCAIQFSSFAQETPHKQTKGKVVFSQRDGPYWQVWIMDLDGSDKKQLTDSKVDKRSPDLSSDGQRIVYTSNEGELMIMDSDGNNNTRIALAISVAEPKWCLQDKRIIFTSYRGVYFYDDSDIWLVNSDSSGLQKIIRRPSIQFLPSVSKDGKEVIFVDVLELSSHEIFKLNMETKDYTQLTDNLFHDTAPAFSADGNMIVYASDKDGNYDIWIMDRFGQNGKNLTRHPAFDSSPAITQDGKTIFFLSDRTKTLEIWSMDLNGENLKQITKDKYDKQDISVYTK